MTSYFKASLWLFAAVPAVPIHLVDENEGIGMQRILDANEVEVLASTAGCLEHVEVGWLIHSCLVVRVHFSPISSRQNTRHTCIPFY